MNHPELSVGASVQVFGELRSLRESDSLPVVQAHIVRAFRSEE